MISSPLRLVLAGFLCGLMTIGTTGCATIMSDGGGDRPVHITTEPSGASIFVKRGMQDWKQMPGETPTTIYLDPAKGSGQYQLKLELDGYEPITSYIDSEIDPWVIGSVALIVVFVIPGVIATAVDFATGAWKKFEYDEMHFNFNERS